MSSINYRAIRALNAVMRRSAALKGATEFAAAEYSIDHGEFSRGDDAQVAVSRELMTKVASRFGMTAEELETACWVADCRQQDFLAGAHWAEA